MRRATQTARQPSCARVPQLVPQLLYGSLIPRPIKLKVDSARIAAGMLKVSVTTIGPAMFGTLKSARKYVYQVRDLLATSPRLSGAVAGLTREHGLISGQVDNLVTRVEAPEVIEDVDAYEGFEPVPLALDEWRSRWLPGLAKDGVRVGLNWSGVRAVGYDLDPEDVEHNLEARLHG